VFRVKNQGKFDSIFKFFRGEEFKAANIATLIVLSKAQKV
jgi:hypothetical protein